MFTSEINGIEYQIYSQAVPPAATQIHEVQFYLFFLIEKDKSYASAQITEIEFQNRGVFLTIVIIILFGFIAVLIANLYIALRTANSITQAIDVMTEYTNRLKRATNVDGKRKIIAQISNDALFIKTSEVFEKMKLAKKALFNRYKQELEREANETSQSKPTIESARSQRMLNKNKDLLSGVEAI